MTSSLSGTRPWTRANSATVASASDLDRRLGDARIARRDVERIARPGDDLRAEREALLADDPADMIEPRLVILPRLAAAHRRGERGDVADRLERARVDQPVEQVGAPRRAPRPASARG